MAKRKAGSNPKGQYREQIDLFFTQQRKRLGGQGFPEPQLDSYYSQNVANQFKTKYQTVEMDFGRRTQAHYDFTAQKTKLRERGTIKYIPIAERELAGILDRKDVPWFMFHANSIIGNGGYDAMDEDHKMTSAAAIWILDQLLAQKQMEELYKILLSVDIPGDVMQLPLFKHPVHPIYLVELMTLLIIHRNDGLYDPSPIPTPWADEWTLTPVAERRSTEGFPLRQAFEAIIALLKPEAISAATERYEKNIWDVYRLVASAENQCNRELNKLHYQMEALRKQQGLPKLVPPAVAASSIFTFEPSPNASELDRLQQRREQIELAQGPLFTSITLSNNREKDLKPLRGAVSDEVLDALVHFSVGDPIETAFALLWLLDSGSMLPWAYYGSLTVFDNALDQLPFHACPGVPSFESAPSQLLAESTHTLRYPYHRWPNLKDAEDEPVQRNYGMSFSQIIYRCTGCILPRTTTHCDHMDVANSAVPFANDLESLLNLLNLETEKEKLLAHTLVDLLNASWLAFEHSDALQNHTAAENVAESTPEEYAGNETEAYKACFEENQKLNEQLKNAHNAYHRAELERKHAKKENELLKKEQQQLRMQLHDLRTIVFQQSNGTDEIPVNPQIVFPASVTKRIVAYGGHATWLKQIRTLLPEVRFIAPDMQPNEFLFQQAEEIWIQPNCLSHSAFYKLADISRKNNIPLRYFAYASAVKCAEQLAMAQKSK